MAAALGGAERVVTVDIAEEAVADARENFRLNGLDPDRHAFEAADAFAWSAPDPVALMVLDPPSLARSQAAAGAAANAYRKLHRHHRGQIPVGGLLATSSCTARISAADWAQAVADGLGAPWSWLHRSREPADHPVAVAHPEGDYLKFALLARRG